MIRLSFVLMLIACAGMSISIVFAQGEGVNGGTLVSWKVRCELLIPVVSRIRLKAFK